MKATIDDSTSVFTLINTFDVRPDQGPAVARELRRFTDETARFLDGFVATSVHLSVDGERVVNYVQWRTGGDLDSMLALPAAKAHMEALRNLSLTVTPVVYTVDHVVSTSV